MPSLLHENNLQLDKLKGVGPKTLKSFHENSCFTVFDLIFNFPIRYEDRSYLSKINNIKDAQSVKISGVVQRVNSFFRAGSRALQVSLSDDTGHLNLFWFRTFPGMTALFQKGKSITVFGQARKQSGTWSMVHPDFCKNEDLINGQDSKWQGIQAVYKSYDGIAAGNYKKIVTKAVEVGLAHLTSSIPGWIEKKFHLENLHTSIQELHEPSTSIALLDNPFRKRMVFEECFWNQVMLLQSKNERTKQQDGPVISETSKKLFTDLEYLKLFPYVLSHEQIEAIETIAFDFQSKKRMLRLLQGDVGCGKTAVAWVASWLMLKSGYDVAMLVPTTVLALQQFENASIIFHSEFNVQLHVQGEKPKQTDKPLKPTLHIGTHALFSKAQSLENVALFIIDEQHRFGVSQRQKLIQQTSVLSAHVLMMTATPIPRTLTMAMLGDIDISSIQIGHQTGRKIVTTIVEESELQNAFSAIQNQVKLGKKAFIVFPIINDSEVLDLKSATSEFNKAKTTFFKGNKMAMLHGKMDRATKEKVLHEFKNGDLEILYATTVIEVGVDIARADVIVIYHPERMGLAQLHQLRGRVGRHSGQAQCYLVGSCNDARLQKFCATASGFEIAELDLRWRGSGDVWGTRQSGELQFKYTDMHRDVKTLEEACTAAKEYIQHSDFKPPDLEDTCFGRLWMTPKQMGDMNHSKII